ncbi:uncharacterized protein A4U43_C06F9080 [Asparagus officinalis]|uniref:Uncharacterized protein n=1 Tax=Asparagus officinalis TaxID=4686 RepID=A0A5P1ELJ0_ASPOF|nr:uncharacterized protein A4U43_C06F9080 [Asparagus officinalis]
MVEVIIKGKSLFLSRPSWEGFYSDLKQGPNEGRSHKAPSEAQDRIKSIPSSSFRNSIDVVSSSTQPPSFERPPRLQIHRHTPLSLYHKPYHRFMASCQPILEEVLSTKKGYEFLVYKGGPSSEFSWKDFGILWQAIELEVRHHLSSDEPPPVPSHHDPQEDAKGKRVIDNFLNSAGNEEVVKVT